jgi:hypothetical protein
MRLLASILAAVLFASLPASATILIYDGPAPAKGFGAAETLRRNRSFLILDTITSQAQLVNFFGKGKSKDYDVVGPIPMDSASIPGARGSQSVATGILRTELQPSDFDTIAMSYRGKNVVLDRSPQLIAPRVISGTFRRTTKNLADISHIEQRFLVTFNKTLTKAAKTNEETLEQAVERVTMILENKGFED